MKKKVVLAFLVLSFLCSIVLAEAYEPLKIGSKGESVVGLQKRLNEIGYNVGVIDGSYGNKTAQAIIKFQNTCGLNETGIADEETQRILFSEDYRKHEKYRLAYDVMFGMSFDDIRKIYDDVFASDPDWINEEEEWRWNGENDWRLPLSNNTSIFNINTIIRYKFTDDTLDDLEAVLYHISKLTLSTKNMRDASRVMGIDEGSVIVDYSVINSKLIEEFGDPTFQLYSWKNRETKEEYDNNIEDAIYDGVLSLFDDWETEKVVIEHELYLDEHDRINHKLYMFRPNESGKYDFGY